MPRYKLRTLLILLLLLPPLIAIYVATTLAERDAARAGHRHNEPVQPSGR
jgi:hypothetical protein